MEFKLLTIVCTLRCLHNFQSLKAENRNLQRGLNHISNALKRELAATSTELKVYEPVPAESRARHAFVQHCELNI